jgi:catechol 2,3-dioxygenase-like lactoylglutathione lyase family enzyme
MRITHVAGVTPIVPDGAAGAAFYKGALGLPLEGEGDYLSSDDLPGARHLGVWPLSMAAHACFGVGVWPADRPVPQATIEFDVATPAEVAEAAAELQAAGYELVHPSKVEPWGQTIARLQDPAGLLIGIAHTPWQHDGS